MDPGLGEVDFSDRCRWPAKPLSPCHTTPLLLDGAAPVRLIRDFGMDTPREELIDVEMLPDATGRKLVGTIEVSE